MKATLTLAVLLTVTLVSLTLLAQEQPATAPAKATTETATTAPAPTTRPAYSEATANELIKSLLMEKPKRPILPLAPVTMAPATQPSVAPESLVRPIPVAPGSMIYGRLGRLVKDSKSEWWTFSFESEKNVLREPPVRILPNRLLETMESISEEGSKVGIKFIISGELTEYRGTNYLLLRNVRVERDLGAL